MTDMTVYKVRLRFSGDESITAVDVGPKRLNRAITDSRASVEEAAILI